LANKMPKPVNKNVGPILLLGTQMALAGAQEVLLTQGRWFHNQGYKVVAVFFYDKQELHQGWQQAYDFPIINLKAWKLGGGIRNLGRLMGGLSRLCMLMLRGKFTTIETFTPHSNLLGIPLAWLMRIPVRVATHHGALRSDPAWLPILHRWVINSGMASKLIAVSAKVKKWAAEVEKTDIERIQVITNGIELRLEDLGEETIGGIRDEMGMEAGGLLIFTAGRLSVQKGHCYLLEAIPAVLARYPKTKFAIAGEGELREELEGQIEALDISGAVKLLGNRTDIQAWLQAADIFVLSSLWEGLAISLLEAMAAKLPAVVTAVEGVEEVMKDQENGLIVPIKDSQALAEGMIELIADEEKRRIFGEKANRVVERWYNAAIMCEQYEGTFIELLNTKK